MHDWRASNVDRDEITMYHWYQRQVFFVKEVHNAKASCNRQKRQYLLDGELLSKAEKALITGIIRVSKESMFSAPNMAERASLICSSSLVRYS
jgi:hypothetical protein